jgi:hypothetical protein
MKLFGLGREGNVNGLQNNTLTAGNPSGQGIVQIDGIWVISIQLIIRSLAGAFTGTWLIEASNNYAPAGISFGQPPNAGDWTDIGAQLTPALTPAVTANGTQMLTSPAGCCGWRAIRVTLTRTGGTSAQADVWLCGKGD